MTRPRVKERKASASKKRVAWLMLNRDGSASLVFVTLRGAELAAAVFGERVVRVTYSWPPRPSRRPSRKRGR